MDLREVAEHRLPGIALAALRFARADDPAFPGSAGKRGAELLYRIGDLKKWARNRPAPPPAPPTSTDHRRAGRISDPPRCSEPVRFCRHDPPALENNRFARPTQNRNTPP
ncbi:hypothetical protein [Streptomyces rimosus]|uniref:hypothetical protein n=1 Tax=Streptomyces rimosus TaxID=1927 RepID=UPI0037D70D6C